MNQNPNNKKLYEKIDALSKENESLKNEIELLKKLIYAEQPMMHDSIVDDSNLQIEKKDDFSKQKNNSSAVIDNLSSPDEKIKLFLSLFIGRPDAYAKKWINRQGITGFSPVCKNEWIQGLCNKGTIKCADCKNAEYVAYGYEAADSHLRGKSVIGIYPLLADDTCRFLAIDLDKGDWQRDSLLIKSVCSENGICFCLERSQSGNGAHVWFFFKDTIPAKTARMFGSAILTEAMEKCHEIGFESYDRLFPNQDTVPKGGFGNLIALPLQAKARKSGNSVFIDDKFIPYPDQWLYLSRIELIEQDKIERVINKSGIGDGTGFLKQEQKPGEGKWFKKDSKIRLSEQDMPSVAVIEKANLLYIDKQGFSEKALNKLKRFAAFKNPEFYKAQAMRLSVRDKPRVISLSEEQDEYIALPRGCEQEVTDFLKQNKVKVNIRDLTNPGIKLKVEFNGKLRERQTEALNSLMSFDNGVLSAATAFGKTVVAAALIAKRKVNTMILVHSVQLAEQWKDKLEQFLLFDESMSEDISLKGKKEIVGMLGGGKKSVSGLIDICIMQSLVRKDEVKEFVSDYAMVIVDECHHVPAFSFERILRTINARYVYGLSATPIRRDGHHPILFMHLGPVRYIVDAKEQAMKRPFDHVVIPRFTSFRKPLGRDEKEWPISRIYTELSQDETRNRLLISDIEKSINDGKNPLILTERKNHADMLTSMLSEKYPYVVKLTGGMSASEKRDKKDLLADENENRVIIVATGRFIGEGFDEPRLDTLFLAMPVAWKGTVSQYAGRLHRNYENKNEVRIYDYVDIHVGVLERMYQKRLKGYAAIGYRIKSNENAFSSIDSIFTGANFKTHFKSDLLAAKREIIIKGCFESTDNQDSVPETLKISVRNGVSVTIAVESKEIDETNRGYKFIKDCGFNVSVIKNIEQRFAVIDQRICWYGNVNLLGVSGANSNTMRIDNADTAEQLINLIEQADKQEIEN